jgi:hypothetical protein
VKKLVAELCGESLDLDVKEEHVGQVLASRELMRQTWLPPKGISRQQLQELAATCRSDALLQKWPQLKLGILGGKTPSEAAADPSCRIKELAAILVLSIWDEESRSGFDFNQLRSRLGLPTLEPIDPRQTSLEGLSLMRLPRVIVEELSDEALLLSFRRAVAFNVTSALEKLGRAIVDRPSLAGRDEQLRAYSVLARVAEDPVQGLRYLDQGRQAAEAAGQSSASWDLVELSMRLGIGDGEGAMRLMQHIQSRHLNEAGVAEALTNLLVRAGVLRPDGTPAPLPPGPAAAAAAGGEAAPEAGKLWTPGGQTPGGGGKIWVPE